MNVPLNINWQQILLHLFNFIILAGGLYILLYKPVKNFMQKREDYYREIDDAAKAKLNAAESAKTEYAEKLKDVQKEIDGIKSAAAAEADKAAKERIAAAENEKNKIIEDAKRTAQAEKDKILLEANSEIENMVSAAIDKVLSPKSGNSIDEFLDAVRKE